MTHNVVAIKLLSATTIVIANIKSYIYYYYYFGHISATTFGVVIEKLPFATTIVVANIKIDLRQQYRH